MGDLNPVLHRLAPAERAGAHAVTEGVALKQLRNDVGRPVVVADVVDRDDVGVVQESGGAGLLLETAAAVLIGRELTVEDLEGHLAGEAQVLRAVDLAHAATTEERNHLVGADLRSRAEARLAHAAVPLSVVLLPTEVRKTRRTGPMTISSPSLSSTGPTMR